MMERACLYCGSGIGSGIKKCSNCGAPVETPKPSLWQGVRPRMIQHNPMETFLSCVVVLCMLFMLAIPIIMLVGKAIYGISLGYSGGW